MSSTQRHHYLAQVYLRQFATSSGDVWRYDRSDGSCKAMGTRVIGVENNLYTIEIGSGISQALENEWFSRLDGKIGPILEKLTARDGLSSRELSDLALFVAYLYVRTPSQIRQIEAHIEQMKGHLDGLGGAVRFGPAERSKEPPPREFTMIRETQKAVSANRADPPIRNSALRVLMSVGVELATALERLRWTMFFAASGRNYVVADNPVAIIPPERHDPDLLGVGPLTQGVVLWVPLTAGICARISQREPLGELLRIADAPTVRAINQCQLLNAERYLFSTSNSLLANLTKHTPIGQLNISEVVFREAASPPEAQVGLIHFFAKPKLSASLARQLPSE